MDRLSLPGPLLVYITCAWLSGIFLTSYLVLPFIFFVWAFPSILLLLIAYWSNPTGRLFLLLLLCFLAGAGRYAQNLPLNDPHNIMHEIGSSVEIQGTVSDEPKSQGRLRTLHITVSQFSRNGGLIWNEAHGEIALQTLGLTIEDPYGANAGDSVSVSGTLQPPLPHSAINIVANMTFPKLSVLQPANILLAWLYHFRIVLSNVIERALPQPQAALLIVLLLSLRTPSLTPLIPTFNVTGTAHLLAPSGFKVTLLAGIITNLVNRLLPVARQTACLPADRRGGWRTYCTTLIVILSIFVYTFLSGTGPAAIRAGIMGSLLVIAPRLGRTYNFYSALALTALCMSLYDPMLLWDPGFQLSFTGTLGIVVLTPYFLRLLHLLPFKRLFLGETIIEIWAVTLAAQISTLPFIAADFQQISFVAPLTNTLTVPLLGPFILFGLILCMLGLITITAAQLAGWFLYPLLWYTKAVVTFCAQLPGAYLIVAHMDNVLSLIYYIILVLSLILLKKRQVEVPQVQERTIPRKILSPRIRYSLQACIALLILLSTTTNMFIAHLNTQLTITFFSVGPANHAAEGEAILLQTPDGKTLLIDGGLDASSLAQALDSHLPTWQRSLDLVLLTTPRPDHLDGLVNIVERYSIGTIVDAGVLHPDTTYARWRRTIDEKKMNYTPVQQGEQFHLGNEVTIQVLWPGPTLHKGSNESRDNALVIRILTPFLRVLLLGVTAESRYALQGLLTTVDANFIQAEVVQVEGEESASFASSLQQLLGKTHATLLIETPATAKVHKKTQQTSLKVAAVEIPLTLIGGQIIQTKKTGSFEVTSSTHGITFFPVEGE